MAASDSLQPQQLKMFMTSEEIMSEYQPLDADRSWKNAQDIPRGGEMTRRPRRTNNGYNDKVGNFPDGADKYMRRQKDYAPEPDAVVWNRKKEEADVNGLTSSVQQHGVVHPVNLGNVIGQSGKPQVTGGHHRIAASQGTGKLIPVLHHDGLLAETQKDMKKMGKQYL